jgi:hypothetical protein
LSWQNPTSNWQHYRKGSSLKEKRAIDRGYFCNVIPIKKLANTVASFQLRIAIPSIDAYKETSTP